MLSAANTVLFLSQADITHQFRPTEGRFELTLLHIVSTLSGVGHVRVQHMA